MDVAVLQSFIPQAASNGSFKRNISGAFMQLFQQVAFAFIFEMIRFASVISGVP